LALTSPTHGGRSVGIVRSWTKATELFIIIIIVIIIIIIVVVVFSAVSEISHSSHKV
jgi:t-SNARE complex subunit (syntaxin)